MTLLLISNIVNLLLARAWQSVLFKPKAFGKEFVNIRAGKAIAVVFLLCVVGAFLGIGLALSAVFVTAIPLIFAASDGEGSPGLSDREVRDVMQRSVLCLSEDQLISDVAGIMKNKNLTRFPVVREGKLVGFLSTTDIIRKLLDTII